MKRRNRALAIAALMLGLSTATGAYAAEPDAMYQEHCASCHGGDRLGGIGPALLPENLGRLKKTAAVEVIAEGRTQTQMPAFGDVLDNDSIAALADYIYVPLAEIPVWDVAQISASQIVDRAASALPATPVFDADPLNLFVVVESGDHHVTILDGDTFDPIARFSSRYALHGGPKFSPEGRYVFFASRDGWISKYDLWNLRLVAEIRAGINTRNLAISHDGKVVAVANYLPHSLVLLDARDLSPLKVVPVLDWRGEQSSRVSAVYQARPRNSFVVALKDVPEVWEVYYADDPPAVFGGFVHNYEKGMEEALPSDIGRFPVRRILLDEPLDDFFFGQDYRTVVGSARDGGRGVVVHLDVGRVIAELPLPGLPHLGSGISWDWQGRRVMATPHLKEGKISIIDMADWSVVKTIDTLGPGFFMRSHANSPYAWVDVFFGPHRDAVHVIDKARLEIVETLRPAPGKTAAHVEFDRAGRHALLSVWEMEGAVIVFDAATLEEVKRLPMVKPSGKYNVYNKITLDEGTSH